MVEQHSVFQGRKTTYYSSIEAGSYSDSDRSSRNFMRNKSAKQKMDKLDEQQRRYEDERGRFEEMKRKFREDLRREREALDDIQPLNIDPFNDN